MAELIREGELLYFYEEDHDHLFIKLCIACKDTDLAYWVEQYVRTEGSGEATFRYDPEAFVTFLIGNMVVKPVPYREIGLGDFRRLPSWMPVEGRVSERVRHLVHGLTEHPMSP